MPTTTDPLPQGVLPQGWWWAADYGTQLPAMDGVDDGRFMSTWSLGWDLVSIGPPVRFLIEGGRLFLGVMVDRTTRRLIDSLCDSRSAIGYESTDLTIRAHFPSRGPLEVHKERTDRASEARIELLPDPLNARTNWPRIPPTWPRNPIRPTHGHAFTLWQASSSRNPAGSVTS
jgi:hypothetical protein